MERGGEKEKLRVGKEIIKFLSCTPYDWNNEVKEDEPGGAYSTHWGLSGMPTGFWCERLKEIIARKT
jgi:hypothetical protein